MSGAAAPSPKVASISPRSPGAADDEPSSYASASASIFAAFGRAPSFKSPLRVQVVKFTREDEGFVNYDITVIVLFEGAAGVSCGFCMSFKCLVVNCLR